MPPGSYRAPGGPLPERQWPLHKTG